MIALLKSDLYRTLRSRWPWVVLVLVALAVSTVRGRGGVLVGIEAARAAGVRADDDPTRARGVASRAIGDALAVLRATGEGRSDETDDGGPPSEGPEGRGGSQGEDSES